MEAVAVRDVYIPCEEIRKDDDGTNWLKFFYTDDDKDPWKWPKVLKYDGMFFKWMSYNSDYNHIFYKQIDVNQIATIVKHG